MDYIDLENVWDIWRAVVNTVMNFRGHKTRGIGHFTGLTCKIAPNTTPLEQKDFVCVYQDFTQMYSREVIKDKASHNGNTDLIWFLNFSEGGVHSPKDGYALVSLPYRDSVDGACDHVTYPNLVTR
jgi:hypothetical protein